MPVLVDGQRLRSLRSLSEPAATVITLIGDAVEWIDWAVGSPNEFYEFQDELDLVRGVQTGLHGTELLVLPRLDLVVSPVKLLELAEGPLNILLEREQGDDDNGPLAARAAKVLKAHQLVTSTQLAVIEEFTRRCGLAGAPFLDSMSLDERIELTEYLTTLADATTASRKFQQEAAEFAADDAVVASDFLDYYVTYMALLPRMKKGRHLNMIRRARKNLARGTMPYLRCLAFRSPPTAEELNEQLVQWTDAGYLLGFKTIGRAVREIASNTEGTYQQIDEARAAVQNTSAMITDLVGAVSLSGPDRGQDGSTMTYVIQHDKMRVALQLSASGQLAVSGLSGATKRDS